MLEALGGPGEQSILSQKKRTGTRDREEEKHVSLGDGESQEDNEEVQVKREHDESPGGHVSADEDEWSEGKAEKREEEEVAGSDPRSRMEFRRIMVSSFFYDIVP